MLGNQFFLFEIIKIIFNDISDEELKQIIAELSEHGLFDEIKLNRKFGIRIYDLIIGTIRQYLNKKKDNMAEFLEDINVKFNQKLEDPDELKSEKWSLYEENRNHLMNVYKLKKERNDI